MVQMYTIFGRQVGSHYLALATLLTTGGGIAWGLSGEKKEAPKPATDASSKEEEEFIQYVSPLRTCRWQSKRGSGLIVFYREFIRQANAEEQKSKH
ncbi:MAG: hypothetical protein Q9164_003577 [Protoblastenia rupestris]